nr:TIGR00366 family protein [Bacillus mediterraneensis]
MLNRVSSRFSRLVERYLPDAFVIAVVLSLIVFVIGFLMNPTEPGTLIESFGDGFWVYLGFTMQMVLLLMTGITLAAVPAIGRILQLIASTAKTAKQAYILTFLISSAAYYVNWGLAVVVGAIIAREVGKRNQDAHFPLLVASAYAPTVLYTAGLSSTIGLTVATEGHFLEKIMGVVPTSETIFHPGTITIYLALLITIPIFILLIAPTKNIIPYKAYHQEKVDIPPQASAPETPAIKLERTPILGTITGLLGLSYVLLKML